MHTNFEFKARCSDLDKARETLRALGARFVGTDNQRDTYFKVAQGRLKLRQGPIENSLIFYERPDLSGPKTSLVRLVQLQPGSGMEELLAQALGVWVVVEKQREIYFLDNVKIHLDRLERLGQFVEVEAIDSDGSRSIDSLAQQCEALRLALGIEPSDFESLSYSDLMLNLAP